MAIDPSSAAEKGDHSTHLYYCSLLIDSYDAIVQVYNELTNKLHNIFNISSRQSSF